MVEWSARFRGLSHDSVSHETFRAAGIDADRCGKVVCIAIANSLSIPTTAGRARSRCPMPFGLAGLVRRATGTVNSAANAVTVVVYVADRETVYVQGKGTSWRSGWLFCTVSVIAA